MVKFIHLNPFEGNDQFGDALIWIKENCKKRAAPVALGYVERFSGVAWEPETYNCDSFAFEDENEAMHFKLTFDTISENEFNIIMDANCDAGTEWAWGEPEGYFTPTKEECDKESINFQIWKWERE